MKSFVEARIPQNVAEACSLADLCFEIRAKDSGNYKFGASRNYQNQAAKANMTWWLHPRWIKAERRNYFVLYVRGLMISRKIAQVERQIRRKIPVSEIANNVEVRVRKGGAEVGA